MNINKYVVEDSDGIRMSKSFLFDEDAQFDESDEGFLARMRGRLETFPQTALWHHFGVNDALSARIAVRMTAEQMYEALIVDSWKRWKQRHAHAESCVFTGNGVDTLCWRCALSDSAATKCSWASRGHPRSDWDAIEFGDNSVRVKKCPAFELNVSGWKDPEVGAILLTALFHDYHTPYDVRKFGLSATDLSRLRHFMSMSPLELRPWIDTYNGVMNRLGSDPKRNLRLRKACPSSII